LGGLNEIFVLVRSHPSVFYCRAADRSTARKDIPPELVPDESSREENIFKTMMAPRTTLTGAMTLQFREQLGTMPASQR
jgi:hypothetical protein